MARLLLLVSVCLFSSGSVLCEDSETYTKTRISERTNNTTGYCHFGKEVGLCRASLPRFYYDVNEQICKKFVYGGCGGNQNNFETQDECQNACNGVTALSTTEAPLPEMTSDDFEARCKAEPVVGLCRASIPRYYFTEGECKRFRYGGCGGNQNNYHSEEECLKTCTVKVVDSKDSYQADCVVPAEPGPCRAAFHMYFFDPSTQSCQSFVYGGCKGNKNRYSTSEECMSNCAGRAGGFDEHGVHKSRWTPAFFLVASLAIMSVVLLVGLLLISIRRIKNQRLLLIDDKQELLPEEYIPEVEDAYNVSH